MIIITTIFAIIIIISIAVNIFLQEHKNESDYNENNFYEFNQFSKYPKPISRRFSLSTSTKLIVPSSSLAQINTISIEQDVSNKQSTQAMRREFQTTENDPSTLNFKEVSSSKATLSSTIFRIKTFSSRLTTNEQISTQYLSTIVENLLNTSEKELYPSESTKSSQQEVTISESLVTSTGSKKMIESFLGTEKQTNILSRIQKTTSVTSKAETTADEIFFLKTFDRQRLERPE